MTDKPECFGSEHSKYKCCQCPLAIECYNEALKILRNQIERIEPEKEEDAGTIVR